MLVIAALFAVAFWMLMQVRVVALAVLLALFPTALLSTPVRKLKERDWRPLLATWTVIVVALGAFTGLGFVVVPQVAGGLDPIFGDFEAAIDEVETWLAEGPLGLSEAQIADVGDAIVNQLQAALAGDGGFIGNASRAVELVTGFFLVLIVMFFLLKDGDDIFEATLARISADRQDRVRRASERAWETLGRYIRGLAIVGLVDAIVIGIGLVIVGVPLVFPLALLVFFGAFFPLVGAFVSGLLAVAVAFANGGVGDALIVLAIITAVQQLEGDIVLPIVFGQTLRLHPLLILLGIAAGGIAFGIVGAFLSVPLIAVALAIREELAAEPDETMAPIARGDVVGDEG